MSKSTFLFDEIIFGPIKSRRLGISLGINLLPIKRKICTFDCIYCECGFNDEYKNNDSFPSREEVKRRMIEKSLKLIDQKVIPNVITFAGNGEPTVHPDFASIVEDTIEVRDRYFPEAKIAVLSNSTQLHKREIFEALQRIDNPILKLDGGVEKSVSLLDKPNSRFRFDETVMLLKEFGAKAIIQTMFLHGEVGGVQIDNSSDDEVEAWLNIIKDINPREVMLYTIDRATPVKSLHKVSVTRLNEIAKKVNLLGVKTQVSA